MILSLLAPEIITFGTKILFGFSLFALGWLYIDAWKTTKDTKNPLIRGIAFMLLGGLSFQEIISNIFSEKVIMGINFLEVFLLLTAALSLLTEPILLLPSQEKKQKNRLHKSHLIAPLILSGPIAIALLYITVSIAYLRKVTRGMEKQLKPAAIAFFIMGISKLLEALVTVGKQSQNTTFFSLATTNQTVNYLIIAAQILGATYLIRWVWSYLRFRIAPQLFLSLIALSITIFFTTTVFFTYLLLNNLETETLTHLQKDTRVIRYALEQMQFDAQTQAESLRVNPTLIELINAGDVSKTTELLRTIMIARKLDFITVTMDTNEVFASAESVELSKKTTQENAITSRALSGNTVSTYDSVPGIIAPTFRVISATPYSLPKKDKAWAITLGYFIDNAFVDRIKQITDLDITIYTGKQRSATTLVAEDGISRSIGTYETDPEVINKVLEQKTEYLTSNRILNTSYYSSYQPITAYNDQTLGMIFSGTPQRSLLLAAQESIDKAFMGCLIIIFVSLIPLNRLATFLHENIEI